MKLSNRILYSAGAFVAVAAIGLLTSPKLTAAVRAAYVEIVMPSQPFYNRAVISAGFTSFGPGTGTLGITNITLTNNDPNTLPVSVWRALNTTGTCSNGVTDDRNANQGYPVIATFLVPGKSTLVIPYPTPLVIGPSNFDGKTCIGAQSAPTTFGVDVLVTGFVN